MKRSQPRSRSAAFFDLDKTILATSTSVALRTPLREAGLLTRRGALLGLLIQLPYLIKGADEQATEKMRESLGEIAAGWDGVYLESTVKDALSRSIDPVCFVEALEEIALHRAAGRRIVIASASIEEMVRPVAHMLGADASIGSYAQRNEDGTFTGVISRFNYADEKARACIDMAQRNGWDLGECFAYSDSITDVPLLEAVGHPVVINPDRQLREIAQERDWPIRSFTHTVQVRTSPARLIVPGLIAACSAAGAAWSFYRAYTSLRGK